MNNKFLIAVIVILLFVASYYTSYSVSKQHLHHGTIDSHQWLHDNLKLSSEQDTKLVPIEKKYAQRKKSISKDIHKYNNKLADQLIKDKKLTPEIEATIKKIDGLQADIQKATLEHIFEMQTILTTGQSEKLLELTVKALRNQK